MSVRPASATEEIENVVLGGGEAGKYIAWELAKQGRPVNGMIEVHRKRFAAPNLEFVRLRWNASRFVITKTLQRS